MVHNILAVTITLGKYFSVWQTLNFHFWYQEYFLRRYKHHATDTVFASFRLFVSSKLKTLRYGFQYSQLCSVVGLKHLQHLLRCNKSDTKSKTNCSYVRIFSSKFHQFIGPIYTGDGSSVWDELWERTVARRIIRLDELSTMVGLTRQTIAIARVDGWSVCLPVLFIHRRIIRRATVLCQSLSQTDDLSPV